MRNLTSEIRLGLIPETSVSSCVAYLIFEISSAHG